LDALITDRKPPYHVKHQLRQDRGNDQIHGRNRQPDFKGGKGAGDDFAPRFDQVGNIYAITETREESLIRLMN